MDAVPVVVIGAGQAGLAVSHELSARQVEHVVLERRRVAETWRRRWDSFCLVTPNWTVNLPGGAYGGTDPEAFARRDEVVDHLEQYALSFGAPVRTGVDVGALRPVDDGFVLTTTDGELRAARVVVCTGAYQRPHRPALAGAIPAGVMVIDVEQYRNPEQLPPGRVVVVGSGQTGCQIAEETYRAGRDVTLACGRAPWAPRRPDGRDIVSWLSETTFFDLPLGALPSPAARLVGNVQATGRDGGHDLNYRTLQAMGVELVGRLAGVDGRRLLFADDLSESVAFGDARYRDIRRIFEEQLPAKGLPVPDLPDPPPFRATPRRELDVAELGAVIFTSGFRPDYRSWIQAPAFDDLGFPLTVDGVSTVVPGLYFCGVHFLRKRRSSLLFGVGEDATLVAQAVAGQQDTRAHRGAQQDTAHRGAQQDTRAHRGAPG